QQTWRPRDELFRYPLTVALVLSLIIAILRKRNG
ncbi:IMP dehydrogenase, partial [Photobacterium damselae]